MSRPLSPRLTAFEAILAWVLALAAMVAAAPLLYAAIGLPALAIAQVLFIAGAPLVVCAGRGELRRAPALLGVNRIRPAAGIGAVLAGASFWYLNWWLVVPIGDRWLGGRETDEAIRHTLLDNQLPVVVIVFVVALVPAICEELLFRGALARALRPRLGAAGAIAVSALMFGVFHLMPAQMLTTAVFGLVLGGVALATDSMLASALVHAANNAAVIVLSAGLLPAVAGSMEASPLPWRIGALVTFAVGMALVLGPGRSRGPKHGIDRGNTSA